MPQLKRLTPTQIQLFIRGLTRMTDVDEHEVRGAKILDNLGIGSFVPKNEMHPTHQFLSHADAIAWLHQRDQNIIRNLGFSE